MFPTAQEAYEANGNFRSFSLLRSNPVLLQIDFESFKTQDCPLNCLFPNCTFSHSSADKRRSISKSNYSERRCSAQCSSQECPFSHNSFEERYHPANLKRVFCRDRVLGQECLGSLCADCHSETEMRIKPLHLMPIDTSFLFFKFKSEFCPYAWKKHKTFTCVYAHNWQDFKRPFFQGQKPQNCIFWKAQKRITSYEEACPDGFSCLYCHGWKELDFHPSKFKTVDCRKCTTAFPNFSRIEREEKGREEATEISVPHLTLSSISTKEKKYGFRDQPKSSQNSWFEAGNKDFIHLKPCSNEDKVVNLSFKALSSNKNISSAMNQKNQGLKPFDSTQIRSFRKIESPNVPFEEENSREGEIFLEEERFLAEKVQGDRFRNQYEQDLSRVYQNELSNAPPEISCNLLEKNLKLINRHICSFKHPDDNDYQLEWEFFYMAPKTEAQGCRSSREFLKEVLGPSSYPFLKTEYPPTIVLDFVPNLEVAEEEEFSVKLSEQSSSFPFFEKQFLNDSVRKKELSVDGFETFDKFNTTTKDSFARPFNPSQLQIKSAKEKFVTGSLKKLNLPSNGNRAFTSQRNLRMKNNHLGHSQRVPNVARLEDLEEEQLGNDFIN